MSDDARYFTGIDWGAGQSKGVGLVMKVEGESIGVITEFTLLDRQVKRLEELRVPKDFVIPSRSSVTIPIKNLWVNEEWLRRMGQQGGSMNNDAVWVGAPAKEDDEATRTLRERIEALTKESGRTMALELLADTPDMKAYAGLEELEAALVDDIKGGNRAQRRKKNKKRGKGVTR